MRQPLQIRRGRYDLILPLGEGRLTRVYLAEATSQRTTPTWMPAAGLPAAAPAEKPLCVVKRLRPELAQRPRVCAEFSAAAHMGTRLHHPQIAETYEVFTEGGEQLFAMEYLEGQSLAELLRRVGRERLPLEEHLHVLCQALAGLAHCHVLGGAPAGARPAGGNHREASASNICITYEGEVKLVDFALPETLDVGRDDNHRGIGPFSPEQLCGLPVDARSDVFAMGILLWEALARRPRAVGDDRAALIAARVAGSELGFEALPPGLPRELIDVCARATELDPAGRYADPGEMLVALETVRAAFPRTAGTAELATLIQRTFQLDRESMCRRINQHLEDQRSGVRLKTPPVLTPEPAQGANDRDPTVPGRIPPRALTPRAPAARTSAGDSEETPLLPARSAGRRLLLLGLAAAVVLVVGVAIVGRSQRTQVAPGETPVARHAPTWEPLARPAVAVDRAPGALSVTARAMPVATAPLPTLTPPAPEPAPVAAPTRPRAKRPPVEAPSASLAVVEPVRRTPVPLLDQKGGVVTVPRAALPSRSSSSGEPTRGALPSSRRQIDEQDPYK
jgi:serine/threonine-protein kinase